jgi:ELWxxDGT repeat protein
MAVNRAVFAGYDTNGQVNFWVTDGTSAGTRELKPAGSDSGGLFYNVSSPSFTRYGAKVLFEGRDAGGNLNLWTTGGTSGGTNELTPGAGYYGVFNFQLGAADRPDFTVFGTKVLFEGVDASDRPNLWITDGTSAGTSEVQVAGASSSGLQPLDLTVLGSKVLFAGVDASNRRALWVTDGTSTGTSEVQIVGLGGAPLVDGNPNFTVLAARHCSLVTTGTSG